MSKVLEAGVEAPLVVHLRPVLDMTHEQFLDFCRINRDLRIELNAEGDLIITEPTGGETGRLNAKLTARFESWSESDGSGLVFDSSTGFTLANGSKRSPDISWVHKSRLADLTKEQKQGFLPLCPEVVVELRSPSDRLDNLQAKMSEFMENGARFGWLIDPLMGRMYIYTPEGSVKQLEGSLTVTADPVLSGFVLNTQEIWDMDF